MELVQGAYPHFCKIQAEKDRLIAEGKIKRTKPQIVQHFDAMI